MIPFDYPALFQAMGGEAQVEPRLDKFFTKLRCWGEPCFNMENEPDFVTPYAYVFAGMPWKSQDVITRIAQGHVQDHARRPARQRRPRRDLGRLRVECAWLLSRRARRGRRGAGNAHV